MATSSDGRISTSLTDATDGSDLMVSGRQAEAVMHLIREHKAGLVELVVRFGSWRDVDGWRERFARAPDIETKREVVRDRVIAAGGAIAEAEVRTPAGLPNCLGLADLRLQARLAGLRLVEIRPDCVATETAVSRRDVME